MPNMLWLLLTGLRSAFRSQRDLALENLALRQQLAVLRRTCKRPRLHNKDRLFWILAVTNLVRVASIPGHR